MIAPSPLPLTARQQKVLDWIRRHLESTGMPPTRAEIAAGLGFSTASSAEDHLRALARKGALLLTPGASRGMRLKDMPAVNHHRPSVDVMMHSVAKAAGANAVGVILTGMGSDGAKGLLAMRSAGAHTIAQDEETSIVYGMPREAALNGGAVEVLPLDKIAGAACAAVVN